MKTPLATLIGSARYLCITFLALLITPNLVIFISSYIFTTFVTAVDIANLYSSNSLFEIIEIDLLTFGIGIAVYFGIVLLTKRKPYLLDIFAIFLSQIISLLMLIAALIHNPQGEFCKASFFGSALAKIYLLEKCSLTSDFWMQAGVVGFVSATFLVLILRFGRSFIN